VGVYLNYLEIEVKLELAAGNWGSGKVSSRLREKKKAAVQYNLVKTRC